MVKRVMIMAGGTGGHVFPALAVAQALQAEGVTVTWLGTRHGLEAQVIPEAGIEIDYISIQGLRGKAKWTLLFAPFRLSLALVQALFIMLKRRPHAVLGMGGFASGPGGVVARLLARPLVIHEQNAVAGLTNRLLATIANRVLEAFPKAFESGGRVRHTGNPVRLSIAQLAEPGERMKDRTGPLRILVVGGSLGALALNQIVPQAIASLPVESRPQVRHQCGKHNCELSQQTYDTARVDAVVTPFIKHMDEALAWADVVVCRAGAMTVAELAAAGVGAILVPFPYAVDDHQSANGRYLTEHGAAEMIQQSDLSIEGLAERLQQLAEDAQHGRERIITMAEQARALAMPNATDDVMQNCLEVMRG
ncbi:MAG: undecaprenyldiphospho-muramoylpentapeptide beta-N-acetylglucosaminyltransferase [Gammaproteobacteria bacterium]|nr:undecaprenyldiphospho-muramoylpentapeptide beta-N-acetylglucosaminyltransferase [Gammaproteobacteria bacterium]